MLGILCGCERLVCKKVFHRKKGNWFFAALFYGRFLSMRIVAIAIAMIMATTPNAMYVIRSLVVARFA